jgi:hypothetical protein
LTFTPKDWANGVAGATAITATSLEDVETRLSDYTDTVTANTQTDNYTLVLADRGKAVEMNKATAVNLTVPPNGSVAFPTGTTIEVVQIGAGQVTFVPGSGVTLLSYGSKVNLTGQYSSATLRKRSTNEWHLAGDLSV